MTTISSVLDSSKANAHENWVGRALPFPIIALQSYRGARRALYGMRVIGLLPWIPQHGTGRIRGVIEISWCAKSLTAFANYRPPKKEANAARFVYDPRQQIVVVGCPHWQPLDENGSPHQQLAQIIGAFARRPDGHFEYPDAAGGLLRRRTDGSLYTVEKSPHLGHNWTPTVRKDFIKFIRELTGILHERNEGS